jgi:hypothetical protein
MGRFNVKSILLLLASLLGLTSAKKKPQESEWVEFTCDNNHFPYISGNGRTYKYLVRMKDNTTAEAFCGAFPEVHWIKILDRSTIPNNNVAAWKPHGFLDEWKPPEKLVFSAEPYRLKALAPTGNARYMLLRQYEFPQKYVPGLDEHLGTDEDLLTRDHAKQCFFHHLGTGRGNLSDWLRIATDEQVIALLKDLLQADPTISWTGFRIMGTVNRQSNGSVVYTLELFAKHEKSSTITSSSNPVADELLPYRR